LVKNRYYILLNVVFPIILGVIIYIGDRINLLPNNISNYIPDGLWAYSFSSTILIIWNRKINIFWFIILGLCFIIFEIMQSTHILKGTGDIIDIIIYFLFGFSSIIINNLISNKN
jgi:hypothetical protein